MTIDGYRILEFRQAWHIRDGRYWREAIARRADGALRLILLPDGHLGDQR